MCPTSGWSGPCGGPAAPVAGDRRVAVVVITYNRSEELARTLTLLEELPERPTVVVVDNASVDGTSEMVRTWHPGVRLFALDQNLGAVGRNVGVDAVETPYVAFCDDDTWYDPGALSRAADILDANPGVAVITGKILVEPGARLDPMCEEMANSPLPRAAGVPGYPLLSFLAGVSIVRKEAFQAAGGFSPRLWLGGEEELLASDLVRSGWQLVYLPEVVAHHHASKLRDAHLRRRHGIRNTLWFTWLRRPLWPALRRTARLLYRVQRDRATLHALAEALGGLPWVIRERDAVPADMERGYRLLEDMQLDGGARRYVS
jgi:N-acetylglucosaminyl-diphospho-decaprenol L-rhamnosyltransferase